MTPRKKKILKLKVCNPKKKKESLFLCVTCIGFEINLFPTNLSWSQIKNVLKTKKTLKKESVGWLEHKKIKQNPHTGKFKFSINVLHTEGDKRKQTIRCFSTMAKFIITVLLLKLTLSIVETQPRYHKSIPSRIRFRSRVNIFSWDAIPVNLVNFHPISR